MTGKQDGIQPYLDQRLDDTRTRIATMRAVSAVVADATDGRTREGKEARRVLLHLTRLMEDLEMLDELAA